MTDVSVTPSRWTWVVAAVAACLTSTVFILVYRWVGGVTGTGLAWGTAARTWGMAAYLLWVFVTVGVLGALGLLLTRVCRPDILARLRQDVRGTPALGWSAAGIGVLVVCTQLAILVAVNACTNPGYAHMVINLNVVLVLLGSYLIFGIPVSGMSGAGVAVAMAGVFLVICGQARA